MQPHPIGQIVPRTGNRSAPWVVLRDGAPLILESVFCIVMSGRGKLTFVTAIRPAVAELVVEPGWTTDDGRPVLLTPSARGWVEGLVKRRGGRLKTIKGRGGFTVRIAKRKRRRLALLFIAMGAFTALMKEIGIATGQNPMLLDGWEEMSPSDKRAIASGGRRHREEPTRRFRADIGRYFRFAFETWIPVRTSDVRWFVKLRNMVRAAAKYAAIELYVWIVGASGCRPGEPQWLTFGAWHRKGMGFGTRLKLRSKNDDGEAEKDACISHAALELVLAYADGERKRLDPLGRGMEYWRECARLSEAGCTKARAELHATPVLLNSEGRRLTYAVVWYHVSSLFQGKNPVTLHYLRHEYVFVEMRRIEKIEDEAARATAKEELCAYMGWASGEAMLACYDAFHREVQRFVNYVAHADRRETETLRLEEPWDEADLDEADLDDAETLAPMLRALQEAIG